MKNIKSILISITIVLSGYAFTMAQDIAPPIQAEPQSLETSQATMPMDVRAEDAAVIIEQMKTISGQSGLSTPDMQGGQSTSTFSGSGYTIMLKPPEVVNSSPLFQFSDVTNRSLSWNSALPMNERSSAVDAYRQSTIRKR